MAGFALDLDHSGIRLLRRTGSSWDVLGEVALDAEDLPDRLTAMREQAEALADGPLETELIIPDSQILYTRLPLPEFGTGPDARAVAAGLEGLTPCPAEDLVFDWRVLGDGVAVAALDINTLDEAESFALNYRFNPVRFSARPTQDQFPDHPDFGPTQFVRDTLDTLPPVFSSRRSDAAVPEEAGEVDNLFADEGVRDVPEGPAEAEAPEADVDVLPPALEEPGAPVWDAPLEEDAPPPIEQGENNEPAADASDAVDIAAALSEPQNIGPVVDDAPIPEPGSIPKAPPLSAAPPPRAPARPAVRAQGRKRQDWRRTAATLAVGSGVLASLVALALFLVAPDELPETPVATGDPLDLRMPLERSGPTRLAATADRATMPDRITPDVERSSVTVTRGRMAERAQIARDEIPGSIRGQEVLPEAPFRAADVWQVPTPPPSDVADGSLEDLYLASIDPMVPTGDALALANAQREDDVPVRPSPVPAQGRSFDLDDAGRVIATADGAETPDGIIVRLGQPALVPPARPAAAALAPDPEVVLALKGRPPRARPSGLVERYERARLGGRTRAELGSLTPLSRPPSEQETTLADASLVPTDRAVTASPLPALRPDDLAARAIASTVARSRASEPEAPAAATPAAPDPAPVVAAAPAPAAPSIPTTASVARQATIANAMNLRRLNLIGVYGSARDRRALVRLPSGRFVKVEVGDRVDGGRIAAIGDGQVSYVKGGRNVTLKVPSG